MTKSLKEFQRKAVDHLINSSSRMLDLDARQNVCVLKSPTGSGKTFMAAAFIEGIIKRREDEICFLWVTIGKGELQLQSRNSLVRFFSGNPVVNLIEDEFTGGRTIVNRNEVVVVNWEKIRSKVKATGAWSNNLMRDGEKVNFRQVLENTRKKRKIILIIDESHIGATAERTQELRNEIDANIVIEISATPKLVPSVYEIKDGTGDLVIVSPKDVIEEGMIKKEIIINKDLRVDSILDLDSEQIVLEKSFRMRELLQSGYAEVGSNINPLVLIQIPNAEDGERKMKVILDFLAQRDITEANGSLAIWLNNYPTSENLAGIALNDSKIKFLIFKQAIDTGWDCPRAQILVKFRETKSEIFEIQILGRILRMPEQRHYELEYLNNAYVYTNISDIKVAKEEYNPNIIKHIKMTRKENYENIQLPSYYKSRADYGDITSEFNNVFIAEACKYFKFESKNVDENQKLIRTMGLTLEVTPLKDNVIVDSAIESYLFDSFDGAIEIIESLELVKSDGDTQAEFDQFLKQHMGTFTNVARSVPTMKSALFSLLKNYLGFGSNININWVQKFILNGENQKHFDVVFTNAVNAYSIFKEIEVRERVEGGEQFPTFEVPSEIYINEFVEEKVKSLRNIMEPLYLSTDRSNVERTFEKILDSNPKIEWWFKNGVNKIEYLGIKYVYPENRVKSFYPDYVVKYTDGTLGVFETKSKGDDENLGCFNEKTRAKAEALAKWKESLIGDGRMISAGIVLVISEKIIYFNDNSNFDIKKGANNDFSDWKIFQ